MNDHPPAEREPLIKSPWPATALVASLLVAYGAQRLLGSDAIITAYGFAPRDVIEGRPFTLVTSQFLHGGWPHLGMNAIWALALTPPVARYLGVWPAGAAALWLLFLASGVLGCLAFAASHWEEAHVMLIGASGGVAGLMGAASRLLGRRGDLAPLTDRRVVTLGASWLGINLLLALLGGTPLLEGAVIGWEAHLAGYVVGLFLVAPLGRLAARWAPSRI